MSAEDRESLGHRRTVYEVTATVVCLPNSLRAAGIVVATPIATRLKPTQRRRDSLNLRDNSSPAPKPSAPRVAAMKATSGTVKTSFRLRPPEPLEGAVAPCVSAGPA